MTTFEEQSVSGPDPGMVVVHATKGLRSLQLLIPCDPALLGSKISETIRLVEQESGTAKTPSFIGYAPWGVDGLEVHFESVTPDAHYSLGWEGENHSVQLFANMPGSSLLRMAWAERPQRGERGSPGGPFPWVQSPGLRVAAARVDDPLDLTCGDGGDEEGEE